MSAAPVLVPAGWALRRHAASATMLALAAAIGLAAAVPALGTGRLRFATVPDGDWAPSPGPFAASAAVIQHRGAATLAGLARALGYATLGVAGMTIVVVAVARTTARRTDIAVRRATGASRRVLAEAALLEGGAIAGVGVVAGLVAGAVAWRALVMAWPGGLGPAAASSAMARCALATGVLVVLGALLPLLHARRREVSPGTGGEELWLPLPAAQFGLALTALVIAGPIARRAAEWTDAGAAAGADLWVVPVAAPHDEPEARRAAWDALLARVARDTPGASLTSPGMALGLGRVDVAITDCGQCVQGLIVVTHRQVPAVHHLVSPDSFRTLGLHLRAGRGITASDTGSARRIAVVGASLARRHFEGGNAVGRLIRIGREAGEWYTVVGVADDRDVAGFGGAGQPPFVVYLSIAQHPPRAAELLLRGEAGARVAGELRAVSAGAPATLSVLRAAQAASERWFAWLIRLEGWAALGAATLGMFAVMRLWVRSRVAELAVRRALGARRVRVLGFIAARVLGVTGGGVAIAWWLAPIAAEAAARVIPGLPAWDASGAVVPVVLLAAATVAGVLGPAWRVATAPPGELLGHGDP